MSASYEIAIKHYKCGDEHREVMISLKDEEGESLADQRLWAAGIFARLGVELLPIIERQRDAMTEDEHHSCLHNNRTARRDDYCALNGIALVDVLEDGCEGPELVVAVPGANLERWLEKIQEVLSAILAADNRAAELCTPGEVSSVTERDDVTAKLNRVRLAGDDVDESCCLWCERPFGPAEHKITSGRKGLHPSCYDEYAKASRAEHPADHGRPADPAASSAIAGQQSTEAPAPARKVNRR